MFHARVLIHPSCDPVDIPSQASLDASGGEDAGAELVSVGSSAYDEDDEDVLDFDDLREGTRAQVSVVRRAGGREGGREE